MGQRVNPENVNVVSSKPAAQSGYSSATDTLVLETETGEIILVDTKRMRATATICRNCYSFDLIQNGEMLATLKGWDKPAIVFFDMKSQRETAKSKIPTSGAGDLKFSSDGKWLALASDTELNLWNVETNELIKTFDGAFSVSFSPDGTLLASASQNGNLIIRELPSGNIRFMAKGFSPISHAVFQNGYIASTIGHWDGTLGSGKLYKYYWAYYDSLFLRDIKTGEITRTFSLSGENPALHRTSSNMSLIFSPNGKIIASVKSFPGGGGAVIFLLDVNTGELLKSLDGSDPIAFSPDSSMLATGTTGNRLVIWDIASGEKLPLSLGLVPGYRDPSKKSVIFSPDGSMLAILSDKIILRDVSTGKRIKTLETGLDPSLAFMYFSGDIGVIGQFSPDGNVLASTSLVATSDNVRYPKPKGIIILWDILNGKKIATLDGHSNPSLGEYSNPITALAFSPDGTLLASGSKDKTIIVLDAKKGTQLRVLKGHSGTIDSLAFSLDGKLLYSGSFDGTVIIWSLDHYCHE